jgi:hypothetical protein
MSFTNANNATFNLQAQYRGSVNTKADVAAWVKKQWATQVRRELEQNLLMRRYVKMITFPDGKFGDRITIPTLGRLAVNRKQSGLPVTLQKGVTGGWNIEITQYPETTFN